MTVPTGLGDPDRAFAVTHVPTAARDAMSTLWQLDEQLGQIVASTTEPMIGQMRLLWWREALESGAAGHPVLDDVTSWLVPRIARADLAAMVDGWDELLEPLPLAVDGLERYARHRGGRLFTLSGTLLGQVVDPEVGCRWALADFACRCSDPVTAARAFDLAVLQSASPRRLPRPLRIMARLADADIAARRRVPRSVWRMLRVLA